MPWPLWLGEHQLMGRRFTAGLDRPARSTYLKERAAGALSQRPIRARRHRDESAWPWRWPGPRARLGCDLSDQ